MCHQLAFAPDGRRLICLGMRLENGRFKGVLQTRELPDGRKLRGSDAGGVEWIGWSAEGDPLAVVLTKGAVVLRELGTGKERRFEAAGLPNPDRGGFVCDCSPVTRTLAATTQHGVLHVWDIASGKKRRTIETKANYFRSVALSPDGRRLAWIEGRVDKPEEARLVDLSADAVPRAVASDQRYLRFVMFSPDAKTLATTGLIDARFWDASTGRERGRTRGVSSTFASLRGVFSPDGKTLAMVDWDLRAVHLWDVATGSLRAEPAGHTSWPGAIDFSPDGRCVATGGGFGDNIFVWDLATAEPLLRSSPVGRVQTCAFSADGRTLFTCSTGEEPKVLDAATGRLLHTLNLTDPALPRQEEFVLSMQLADEGKALVAFSRSTPKEEGTGGERSLQLVGWNVSTREQLFRRRRRLDFDFAVSPDLRVLAVSQSIPVKGDDRPAAMPVRLEDLRTGQFLLNLPQLETQDRPVRFSPDGRLLATSTYGPLPANPGGRPGQHGWMLRLWEWRSAAVVLAFSVTQHVRVDFTSDGRLLALSAPNQEILLWDLRRGKEHARFEGFDADVISLAFSPDGRRLISGLSDTTLLVWEVPPLAKTAALDADAARRAWADLAGDAREAFTARGALAGSPAHVVGVLKERLRSAPAADPDQLRRLIADLDSDRFAVPRAPGRSWRRSTTGPARRCGRRWRKSRGWKHIGASRCCWPGCAARSRIRKPFRRCALSPCSRMSTLRRAGRSWRASPAGRRGRT
jgi:WD40 repeat protein